MRNLCTRISFVQWLAIAVAIVAATANHKVSASDAAPVRVPIVVLGVPLS